MDKYTLQIKDRCQFYYKNGKLHREAGPAIVIEEDINKFTNLADKDLYIEIKKESSIVENISETGKGKSKINSKALRSITLNKTSYPVITFESPIEYIYETNSSYWLEGVLYSKKEFDSILLKKEMDKDLPITEIKDKKIKL